MEKGTASSNKNIAVIIPTYNAGSSIVKEIYEIFNVIPDCRIYIVDDNSPDQTAKLVISEFQKDKRVDVLQRKTKGGRGSAVVYGLSNALKNKSHKFFIEMDADLCHNPKYIPSMVEKCEHADVVVASRYLPGSKIYNWNLKRRLMSFSINTFSKFILQIPISDYTDGFRCYSREAVSLITSIKLQSKGYIVLSEIAYLCYKKGMVFDEVPITFYFEPVTKSNLNTREITEAIRTIIRLKFRNG